MSDRTEHVTVAPETLAPSQLLRALGLEARKGLGQNFLASQSAIHHILTALDLQPDETVVEVGSGLGTLTGYLAAVAGAVVAVELDDSLVRHLQALFADTTTVRIVHGDILTLTPEALFAGAVPPYRVAGNLPYYITSAAIRHVLSWVPAPRRVVVMVQYEVARRIVAGPGEMSLLALMVQMKGVPRIVARIPAGAFVPPPKVNSAVVSIVPHQSPLATESVDEAVFRLARYGFQQRRKMLVNSLSAGLAADKATVKTLLDAAVVAPTARAEDLSVSQWLALARLVEGDA
ncbi:MAG: 16S rRNA (adenine(1518)-N(6)/adenine(1519)-N(6))-dimethyltransferase RsmA [Anaerolineae bacterium]